MATPPPSIPRDTAARRSDPSPGPATPPPGAEPPTAFGESIGKYRWTICALLFFATTINYIDRQVLGLLAPTLQRELGWTETDYSAIVSWFTAAYALGFLGAGRLLDRFGTRIGYATAIVIWSIAAMSHSLARNAFQFSLARFGLGIGESGNFPASIKTVAEWFPAKERAFATGIFNAGTNVGALITPIMVPIIADNFGWRAAFIWTGLLSATWLAFWLVLYRPPQEHPRLGRAELAYIQSDQPPASTVRFSWFRLLTYRQTWAFALGKGLTDPIWWFYLFWLPKFLDARYGLNLSQMIMPLVVIYLIADFGSIFGGWLSGALMKRGWSPNAGRKVTMLIPALLIVPTMFAPRVESMWAAITIVGIAAASHQWWSANLYTIASDMFPRQAVGSVIGIGGFTGALTGFGFQRLTGWILQSNGSNYATVFLFCGFAYLTALTVIHLIVPRLQPARLEGV